MRENAEVIALSASHPHSLAMPQLNHRPTGFTAVNGDTTKHTSFRPSDDSTIVVAASPPGHGDRPSQKASDNSNSRHEDARTSDRNDSVLQGEPGSREHAVYGKRKRSPSDAVNEPTRDRILNSRSAHDGSPRRTILNETRSPERDRPVNTSPSHPTDERITEKPQSPRLPDVSPETTQYMLASLANHLGSSEQASSPEDDDDVEEISRDEIDPSDPKRPAQGLEQGDAPTKRKRNFAHRTKTGCHTCRHRKKKCDEQKPVCGNCIRGSFECGGYGQKPPNFKPQSAASSKQQQVLQSRNHYEMQPQQQPPPPPPQPSIHHIPENHWPPVPHHAHPPDNHRMHPGPYQPPQHHRHPETRHYEHRDGWAPPAFQENIQMHTALPRVDFSGVPPPPMPNFSNDHHPPPSVDPWQPHSYRPPTTAGSVISLRESVSSSNSQQRAAQLALGYPSGEQMSERDKMLIGKPYRHWIDNQLLEDRQQCKAAVERYNRAALPSESLSPDERARFFAAILNPSQRKNSHLNDNTSTLMRVGRIGHRTIVETPFYCDYGYNLTIGEDVVIQPGCYMQDPCEIIIGNRAIIGPNVKFYGMTASIYAGSRKGSQGDFIGGAIKVEDDCFIGADVTILPYRVIGKGAVVGAGSVVTRNISPYTVVAGNPARELRTLGEGPVADRRMKSLIQQQNEEMMRDMRNRRGYREAGSLT